MCTSLEPAIVLYCAHCEYSSRCFAHRRNFYMCWTTNNVLTVNRKCMFLTLFSCYLWIMKSMIILLLNTMLIVLSHLTYFLHSDSRAITPCSPIDERIESVDNLIEEKQKEVVDMLEIVSKLKEQVKGQKCLSLPQEVQLEYLTQQLSSPVS